MNRGGCDAETTRSFEDHFVSRFTGWKTGRYVDFILYIAQKCLIMQRGTMFATPDGKIKFY